MAKNCNCHPLDPCDCGAPKDSLLRRTTAQRLYANDLVEAESVEDFAARYRRYDRYAAQSAEYREAIIETHRQDIEIHGITWIDHYGSNTGCLVAWSPKGE